MARKQHMNLEKLLGLQNGYLKRLTDFYNSLENKGSSEEQINTRSTCILNHKKSECNAFTCEAREAFEVQP